jgi:hypothetical protein
MPYYWTFLFSVCLCGCAGGPTHDYYNPALVNGPKFNGPITIELVDDVKAEKEKCIRDGYTFIGSTSYVGKQPERVELIAQAKRVRANHVIYAMSSVPSAPGSWHFGFNRYGGGGGSDGEQCNARIVFLGR